MTSHVNLDALQGMFDGMNTDLDPNATNNPRPAMGKGIYILDAYGPKETTKKGWIMTAQLVCAQPPPNSGMAVGTVVNLAWMTSDTGWGGKYAKARARDFVIALLGLPPGTDTGAASKRLSHPTQPGTGIALYITASENPKAAEFPNYTYEHLQQDEAAIVRQRAAIPQLKAAATYTPPQMAGAPHPATNPGAYPAQTAIPQLKAAATYTPPQMAGAPHPATNPAAYPAQTASAPVQTAPVQNVQSTGALAAIAGTQTVPVQPNPATAPVPAGSPLAFLFPK